MDLFAELTWSHPLALRVELKRGQRETWLLGIFLAGKKDLRGVAVEKTRTPVVGYEVYYGKMWVKTGVFFGTKSYGFTSLASEAIDVATSILQGEWDLHLALAR
jgi:hypothetical protein